MNSGFLIKKHINNNFQGTMDDGDDILAQQAAMLQKSLGGKKPKPTLLGGKKQEKTTFDSANFFMEKETKDGKDDKNTPKAGKE